MIKLPALNLQKLKTYADWQLLLFLVLFLNVKLGIKIAAIIVIYLLQFNFKFGFRLKNSRLPLFYPLVMAIALFNLLAFKGYLNFKYNLVFLSGLALWLLCILAIHQIKLAADRNTAQTLHRTIYLFFLMNIIVSITVLAGIIWEIKAFNPYTYQGLYQRYFISTGDFIKGITFDVSITNSVISALGVIYFTFKQQGLMLILSMVALLLTGSNALNIITSAMLVIIFFGYSNGSQKSLIVVCLALLITFLVKVSPQNSNYVLHISQKTLHKDTPATQLATVTSLPVTQRPDSSLTYDERREKIAHHYLDSQYTANLHQPKHLSHVDTPFLKRLVIPKPDINTKPYQENADTTQMQRRLLNFIRLHQAALPLSKQSQNSSNLPGKVMALLQTISFLSQHPSKIFTGNGIGNFSSKIAFKATGFGLTGGYPAKYVYINNDFLHYHLDVYLNYFSKNIGLHSVINNPDAVYHQLLGEYGILGILAFFIFYLGYFLKEYKRLTYGIPILMFVMAIFFLEYWFEQLSVMVLVELMLLSDIKESAPKAI